jgi:hypothetical protein
MTDEGDLEASQLWQSFRARIPVLPEPSGAGAPMSTYEKNRLTDLGIVKMRCQLRNPSKERLRYGEWIKAWSANPFPAMMEQ